MVWNIVELLSKLEKSRFSSGFTIEFLLSKAQQRELRGIQTYKKGVYNLEDQVYSLLRQKTK